MCQLRSRMKVDKKSIQVFLWKTIKLSTVTLCKFAKEYPYASVVFFIFLLLYLYVPLVFYTLVLSSPILICTAIFVCFYRANLRKKHRKKEEEETMVKKEEKQLEEEEEEAMLNVEEEKKTKVKDMLVTKSEKGLRAQKSVRRNRRNENIELDTQVNKLERRGDKLISTSPFHGCINGTDLLEEGRRLLAEEGRVLGPNPDPAPCETSAGNPVQIASILEDQKEMSVESSDEEEEGSGFKHSNKAVAWSKDDERNLMDLGLSELERNKRLESLMARRRATKLFRLAVEKTLMGLENTHPVQISTARTSPFDGLSCENGAIPHIPGSAPSVLLPGQNPFDLPYDPQEERPILTGDDFHKEYSTANLKDMLLCRHESFRCGSCHRQDSPGSNRATASFLNKRVLKEPESERGRDKKDEENEPEIQLQSMDKNGQEELEAQTDNASCSLSSSSSSSDSDESSILLNEKKKFPQILTHHVQKVLSLSTPPKSATMDRSLQDWNPVAVERNQAEDHMFFKNSGSWHNHTQSIASDLQVEVSEIGSPPLTVDGTASPTDEVSQISDADTEREITHERDTWDAKNESESRKQDETNKVNEKHEQAAAEKLSGTSLPSAANNITEDDPSHPLSIINQTNRYDPRPDTVGGLQSVPETDPSNVPHGTEIQQRSPNSTSSASPTSVLLNDVLSRQMSANNFEEPALMDAIDSVVENLSQSNLTNEDSDHGHSPSHEPEDARQLLRNSESQTKTQGELGENLSRAAEENSRPNEKGSSSQQVIHEDDTIDDKREQITESGKVIEIVADINAHETEEERTAELKETPEVGVSEKADQGIQPHQVEELVEQSNSAADASDIDSRQELENPVNNEDDEKIMKKQEGLQEAEATAGKSIDEVNPIEPSK